MRGIVVVLLSIMLMACDDDAVTTGTQQFSVVGSVRGLPNGESVVLLNNGGSAVTVSADGRFSFSGLKDGDSFLVRVGTQPASATCVVTKGRGVIQGADASGVEVFCASPHGANDETFGKDYDGDGFKDGFHVETDTTNPITMSYDDVDVYDDGRMIVVGDKGADTIVMRFLEDGRLDPSFGTNGVLVLKNGIDAESVALGGNGEIYLGGTKTGTTSNMAVWKLLGDGSFDTSFGNNGEVVVLPATESYGMGLEVQPDGKPVVVGYRVRIVAGGTRDWDIAACRLQQNGNLDTGFASTGCFAWNNNGLDIAATVAFRNAKMYVVGRAQGSVDAEATVWVLDSSGTLDTTFTDGTTRGYVMSGIGGSDAGTGIALDAAGNIYISGNAPNGAFAMSWSNSGQKRTAFGTGGIVYLPKVFTGRSSARTLAMDSSGRILVAGSAHGGGTNAGVNEDEVAAVWRLSNTGQPDTNFGRNGNGLLFPASQFSRTQPRSDLLEGMALDDQGRIFAAGKLLPGMNNQNRSDAVVWRLVP